jgi:hypothetical protein
VKTMLSQNVAQLLTSLDRSIDLNYPSNRFALLIAVVAAFVAFFLGGSWLIVISSASWAFATWALGRELDPDHPLTAGIASSCVVLLLAFHPASRVLAFEALCATGVLMLTARAALGTTGRALTWGDQLIVALAPILADALSGLPLRMLGLSSFGALFGRQAQVGPTSRSGRVAQQWIWGLAAFSVAWLVAQTLLGVHFLLPSQLTSFSSQSIIVAVILAVVGALNLNRRLPKSKADNGNDLKLEHFVWQRLSVFVGAIVTALFTPWTLWFGLGVVGLLCLVFERLPQDS